MSDEKEQRKSIAHAEDRSIAANVNIGGSVRDFHIGDKVYQYDTEEDVPLTSEEIEAGLTRFTEYLSERAPILKEQFESIARKMRATLGPDLKFLSEPLKEQRKDTLKAMNSMSMEVLDISCRALCQGQNPPPYDSRSPFRGLVAFHLEDQEFYFGREELIKKLAACLQKHPFLAVLGASGTGKSSLVMAGLIPALKAKMAYFTPSSVPLYQLHTARETADKDTVFVVDQFEELFTLTRDLQERSQFISELLGLVQTNRVVLTMRADFWGEVAPYQELKERMQEHQELIPPMTTEELDSAMQKQAAAVGLRFDQALCESILEDVKGEPGAMPLLQHALWLLWQRRHGVHLKSEEYQKFGGVKQAIAHTAEEVYASCSELEQERIRDIFLRLTRLDDSGEGRDTRRRVLIASLTPKKSDPSVTIHLLNKLADKRLIVKTENQEVEVAHEALIRHWKRLVGWLQEDREILSRWENLSEAARDWENSGRSEESLNHRGNKLERALEISRMPRYSLNSAEQAYLDACMALRERERIAREQERAARERLQRIIRVGLSIGFVVALVFAGFALWQARISRAGELAAQSAQLRQNNFQTSLLLGIEAFQWKDTLRSHGALIDAASANPAVLQFLNAHQDSVKSIAISPNGNILASGSLDHTIILWDMQAHKPVGAPLKDWWSGITSVAFSPDGKTLASGGWDGSILFWNVETLKQVHPPGIAHEGAITSVAFSPDGNMLASGSWDGSILFWNVETGELLAPPFEQESDGIISLAFSPDGKWFAASSTEHTTLWDLSTGEFIADFPTATFDSAAVAFSPDGKLLAFSWESRIYFYDLEARQPLDESLVGHAEDITSISFSPDSETIVSGSKDNSIILWDVLTYASIGEPLKGHAANVNGLAFSPDGETLVSASDDNTIILWNASIVLDTQWRDTQTVASHNIGRLLEGHENGVTSIAFSPNGKILASGSSDRTIRLWNSETGELLGKPLMGHTDNIWSIAFSSDGKTLASGSWDKTVRLWDVTAGTPLGPPLPGISDSITSVAFSRDGAKLAAGSVDSTILLWNVESKERIGQPLRGHADAVHSVAFSPDGKTLVSSGVDKTIRLWSVETGQPIGQPLSRHKGAVWGVAFSPDGKMLASGSTDNTVILWDVKTAQPIGSPLTGHTGAVWSVAFSRDGETLVTGSEDHTMIFWDTSTGLPIGQPVPGHYYDIRAVAFSPSGDKLATASIDSTIMLWDITSQSWIDHICGRAGRNLTMAEWESYFPGQAYRKTCDRLPRDRSYYQKLADKAFSNSPKENQLQRARDAVLDEMKSDSAIQDPEVVSKSLFKEIVDRRLNNYVLEDQWAEALNLLKQLDTSEPPLDDILQNPEDLNEFCWAASLNGQAAQALWLCERAVQLLPDDPLIRDSRGLARALTGDIFGAIEDFQFYVENYQDPDDGTIQDRKQWIVELKAGRNPFTPQLLEQLSSE